MKQLIIEQVNKAINYRVKSRTLCYCLPEIACAYNRKDIRILVLYFHTTYIYTYKYTSYILMYIHILSANNNAIVEKKSMKIQSKNKNKY